MQKKIDSKKGTPLGISNTERETKILNVICNTTILLMSIMTEALTNVFTNLSKEMITTITLGLNTSTDTIKGINNETDNAKNELLKQMIEQLQTMKVDINVQLKEKKEKFASIIMDKSYDKGIEIVERYNFNLPNLSCDLDESSLLRYLILLQENNEQFSKMFQELLEWMKKLPQP